MKSLSAVQMKPVTGCCRLRAVRSKRIHSRALRVERAKTHVPWAFLSINFFLMRAMISDSNLLINDCKGTENSK